MEQLTFTDKSARQYLNELHAAHLAKKSTMPATEIAAICRNKTRKLATANGLTAAVIDAITYCGGMADRHNVMGRKVMIKGVERWITSSSKKGGADILATYRGLSIHIEIKVGKDTMKPAQHKMQQQVEAAGGVYKVVSTLCQFLTWWINDVMSVKMPVRA